jgi:FemAB-related protein (PEP-CTERM system-associated)
LHGSLQPWSAEITYAVRALLRIAGLPYEFVWVEGTDSLPDLDIYYGPPSEFPEALVSIAACGKDFMAAGLACPQALREREGLAFLDFGEREWGEHAEVGRRLRFSSDIVFACYWLLTGAQEWQYRRDRWDNMDLAGSFVLSHALLSRPLLSIYGAYLRSFFERLGYAPLEFPWTGHGRNAAFVFSHDVDYPEIIRWLECFRLLARRGIKALPSAYRVLRGTNHFWKFSDWVEFEKDLYTRPGFYFMPRKGSLLEYAAGTPDAFYDIRRLRFRELFHFLRDEGCEIGLHASYHAYQSCEELEREKSALEEAAQVSVEGIRHHYWHLDPTAPHETLYRQEQAGFRYDSSLAFEFFPGFRRGICHPFRVFHPGLRRELGVLELPPAWMDDHFDRRLAQNRIRDADAHALALLRAAQDTGGVVIVDYHARGMNADFYPRYGPWIRNFVQRNLDSSVAFRSPRELARQYSEYEARLEAASADLAGASRRATQIGSEAPAGSAKLEAEPSVPVGFLRPEEFAAWDAFVEAHPDGTIYHTLGWKAVTEEGLGHRAYYLRAVDEGGKVAGVLPLFLVQGIFGRRLVSVPMRDRGGVLARNSKTASQLVARAVQLAQELRCEYLELRSLLPMEAEVVREQGLLLECNWITTRIDLSQGEDQLWKALDRDAVRWAIRNAERRGVSVEMDNSEPAVETFYELFVRTRTAMGIPPFPKSLFLALWKHLIRNGKANLFLVRKDSEPIHAMINLLSKDTFVPAYAAPQNAWRKWYPSECVFWHTIRWAARQGFRYYDFGADSPRQAGLLWFKKKWGGVQQPMHYHFRLLNGRQAPPNFDSSSQTYLWTRKAWALLPTAVSKKLGGWVTRQLS